MKTVRDILQAYGDVLLDLAEQASFKPKTIKKEVVVKTVSANENQALKELEELLIESLPDNKEPAISAFKAVPKSQMLEARNNTIYNQAIEDTRKAIKLIIRGK